MTQEVLLEIMQDIQSIETLDRLSCMVVIVRCLNSLTVEIDNWKKRIGALSAFNSLNLTDLRAAAKGMAEATFLFLKQAPQELPPPPQPETEEPEPLPKKNDSALV